jgi:hypothetical protein
VSLGADDRFEAGEEIERAAAAASGGAGPRCVVLDATVPFKAAVRVETTNRAKGVDVRQPLSTKPLDILLVEELITEK